MCTRFPGVTAMMLVFECCYGECCPVKWQRITHCVTLYIRQHSHFTEQLLITHNVLLHGKDSPPHIGACKVLMVQCPEGIENLQRTVWLRLSSYSTFVTLVHPHVFFERPATAKMRLEELCSLLAAMLLQSHLHGVSGCVKYNQKVYRMVFESF